MARATFNLRLPEDLREQAQTLAERNGLSLNALCVTAIRSHVDWHTSKRRTALTPRVLQTMAEEAGVRGPGSPGRGFAPSATSAPVPKVGANQPCPCGSGTKYKRCHGRPGGTA